MRGRSLSTDNPQAQSRTNIALFNGDVQNFYRQYTTDVKILQGLTGGDMNAGILVNYTEPTPGSFRYHVALLNLVNSTFGIYYFNGATLVSLGVPANVTAARPGAWYRIQLTVRPPASMTTVMTLQASLRGITQPTVAVDINTNVGMNLWDIDGVDAGLYSRRSRARFSYWHIDQVM